jgi:hypothetical protein
MAESSKLAMNQDQVEVVALHPAVITQMTAETNTMKIQTKKQQLLNGAKQDVPPTNMRKKKNGEPSAVMVTTMIVQADTIVVMWAAVVVPAALGMAVAISLRLKIEIVTEDGRGVRGNLGSREIRGIGDIDDGMTLMIWYPLVNFTCYDILHLLGTLYEELVIHLFSQYVELLPMPTIVHIFTPN